MKTIKYTFKFQGQKTSIYVTDGVDEQTAIERFHKRHEASMIEPIRDLKVKNKAVEKYTKDGVYIKTYRSIKVAAEAIGINPSTISKASRKESNAGGYIWKISK